MLPSMNDREAVKVLIVNDDGQYLAGTATDWKFTEIEAGPQYLTIARTRWRNESS